jgi:bifunctional enzyme CysN/CysC
VVCVNKMDLVGYDQARYEEIKADFRAFATKLEITDLSFVPISALHGDNVVHRSANMPWYEGGSLLHILEEVHIASDRNLIDARFPVQYVVRPTIGTATPREDRRYAGTVAGGIFRPGDEVVVLPSGFSTTIASIDTADGPVAEAFTPMALTDDLDVGRGDMICRPHNQPQVSQDIEAMVCWMGEQPLARRGKYVLKHTTRSVRALVSDVQYRLDINTLHRDDAADGLALNEIGRVSLRTTSPLFTDEYRRNRTTGSFVLIDEATSATVAAGMVLHP